MSRSIPPSRPPSAPPNRRAGASASSRQSDEFLLEFDDGEDDVTDPDDRDADDHPTPERGTARRRDEPTVRLSATLMSIFKRRRQQIGLTVAQVAKLAGVAQSELELFESSNGEHRLNYDHAVVVARVLGVKPSEMPGLRGRDPQERAPLGLDDMAKLLCAGPMLLFEGRSGERFSGDVDVVITAPSFAVKLGDSSLGDPWVGGMVLGFLPDAAPRAGDVVLVRHRKSRLLALRRLTPPHYLGLAPWQPTYVVSQGEWLSVGRLHVILPRP